MQVLSFPGCCTAKVIAGFGQESNAGWSVRSDKAYTLEQMKEEIHRLVSGPQIGRHYAIVTAALTTRQTTGIQALTELGWQTTGAKDKRGHSETDLLMFFINPKEYMESEAFKALDAGRAEREAKIREDELAKRKAMQTEYSARVSALEPTRLMQIEADTTTLARRIRTRMESTRVTLEQAREHEKRLARRRWATHFTSAPPAILY